MPSGYLHITLGELGSWKWHKHANTMTVSIPCYTTAVSNKLSSVLTQECHISCAHPWTVANACVSCTQAKISNLSWFLTASQRGLLALMGPDFPSEHLPLQTSYRSGTLLSYVEDKYSSGRSCKYLYRKPTWEVILTPSKQAEICGDIHRKVVKQDKWSCSQDQA